VEAKRCPPGPAICTSPPCSPRAAIDLDADPDHVTAELRQLAVLTAGRPSAATAAGARLHHLISRHEPWNPTSVLAAVGDLAANPDPAAGVIAVWLLAAIAASLSWPATWRAVIITLRVGDPPQLVPGKRQIGAVSVERQVHEQPAAAAACERTNHVVLLAERDQDVLDGVVQLELHGPHLRPDDFGVARCGDGQIQVLVAPSVPSAMPLV
jgi:hypothetical protein